MNSRAAFRRISLFPLVLGGLIVPLQAQAPAATFEQLRTNAQLKKGETIEVTENDGTKYKARIAELSGQLSVITAAGVQRDLTESNVREIRHRRSDKLWNGALIGAGGGAGFATVTFATACSGCDPSFVLGFIYMGIGAGAGAVIDLAIRKHETVFANPGARTTRSLHIYPILDTKTTGARVALNVAVQMRGTLRIG